MAALLRVRLFVFIFVRQGSNARRFAKSETTDDDGVAIFWLDADFEVRASLSPFRLCGG